MADDAIVVPLDSSGLHYEVLVRTPRALTAVRADLDPRTRLVAAATPAAPAPASPVPPALLATLTGVSLDACATRLAAAATAAATSPAAPQQPTGAEDAAALAHAVAALGPAAVAAVARDCTAVTLRAVDRAGVPHTGVLRLAAPRTFATRELPRDVCRAVAAAASSASPAPGAAVAAAAREYRRAVAAHERVWAELDALDALQARWSGHSSGSNNTERGVLRRCLDVGRGALLTVTLCAARPRARPAWDVDGAPDACTGVCRRLEEHVWDAQRPVAENLAAALGDLVVAAAAPAAPAAAATAGTAPAGAQTRECALCFAAECPDGSGTGVDGECDHCHMLFHRYCLRELPDCETKAGTHSVACPGCQATIIF